MAAYLAGDKIMSNIKLFESKHIRSEWDDKTQKWYFAIVDVISALTASADPGAYWRKLKERLKKEGNETVTNCHALKMTAEDGKKRMTNVADAEQLLRLIQSVPSPKAEPFKIWLARVGYERLEEIENPELSMERMKSLYEKKGYPKDWIDKRMRGIAVRQDLTDEWQNRGAATTLEYAILTNEIMQGAFDLKVEAITTRKYFRAGNCTKRQLFEKFEKFKKRGNGRSLGMSNSTISIWLLLLVIG